MWHGGSVGDEALRRARGFQYEGLTSPIQAPSPIPIRLFER